VNADLCVGCGKCTSNCYIEAIDIVDDRAVIRDTCRVCGRCAMKCPKGAIVLKARYANPAEMVFERIDAQIDNY